MNETIAYYVSLYLAPIYWYNVLLVSKEWNESFKPFFIKEHENNTFCFMLKGLSGDNVAIYFNIFNDTWKLKKDYITRVVPDWKGKKGTLNFYRFYRFINNGKQLENNKKLFSYFGKEIILSPKILWINVVGSFGSKASPLTEDINLNNPNFENLYI